MKKSLLLSVVAILAMSLPMTALALVCPSGPPQDFTGVLCIFIDLASTAIPIVAGIALWMFFLGLANFILAAGSDEGRKQGKQIMIWGIISLFVLVSIWGIITWLSSDIFGPGPLAVPLLPS